MAQNQVIVVGGGLAGMSAVHTVLERGARVLLIDKSSFLGGNSTKGLVVHSESFLFCKRIFSQRLLVSTER
jgi:heterodisulfide reductase subunit A-like polyferredoxin